MNTTRSLFLSCCVLGLLGAAANAQRIEWVPVHATGGHTIDGNTIILDAGGQTVTLHLMLSEWDPETLGSYQGTVDSSGYLGANAVPPNPGVDLTAIGWPITPDDGAFLALKVCSDDIVPPMWEEFDPLSVCTNCGFSLGAGR